MTNLSLTTEQDMNRNPEGKGGFGDNPQHRSPGGWKKEDTISYQYNLLMRMTVDEMKGWLVKYPHSVRTIAQNIAYEAMLKANKDFKYLVEITDRTEGKARQVLAVEDTREVEEIKAKLKAVLYGKPETNTSETS